MEELNFNLMKQTKESKTMEQMVNETIENFDFDKVQLTMKALNWTWWGDRTIPTKERMIDTAKGLLNGAMEGAKKCDRLRQYEPYFNATGGFKAYCFVNKYKHITSLHLEFIVSEWETDAD